VRTEYIRKVLKPTYKTKAILDRLEALGIDDVFYSVAADGVLGIPLGTFLDYVEKNTEIVFERRNRNENATD